MKRTSRSRSGGGARGRHRTRNRHGGGTAAGGRNRKKSAKKMTITPFAVRPSVSASLEAETVEILMNAVSDIFMKRGGECSFEELYRFCHSLCTVGRGQVMYERLYTLCDEHIGASVDGVAMLRDSELLRGLHRLWTDYKAEMAAMRQVFLMLDRSYIRQQTEAKSLWKMGIVLLQRHFVEKQRDRDIAGRATNIMVQRIDAERNGEEIDKALLRAVVTMTAHLKIYKSRFEPLLVAQTKRYYADLGRKLMAELTVPDYVDAVIHRLDDEHRRCHDYLDHATLRPLAVAVEQQMVEQHHALILDKGFAEMCQQQRVGHLRHLYALYHSVHRLDAVHEHFERFCKRKGLRIVNAGAATNDSSSSSSASPSTPSPSANRAKSATLDLADRNKADSEMVPKLLAFKERLDELIAKSFAKNPSFRRIIRKSWEFFLNQRHNKPAELMAKFVDHQLQRGGRGISEQELEATLDGVMDILRFVEGKDVFQAFYKKDLAKRLLLNTSSSFEAEKGMILRIRKECGANLAANLENMFKDIAISQDLATKFERDLAAKFGADHDSMEYDVRILTSGCWPTYNTTPIALPEVVQKRCDSFCKFYVAMNSGRKLLWTASLSHCILAAHFPKGRKELVLSAFQATVLLQFNAKNKFSFGDLFKATKIERGQLKRTMLSLVKASILLKRTKGMECGDAEEFKLNAKYENRLRRVKVNQIQIVETKQERIKTAKQIDTNRQYQIDAAIVRIMKSRKTLVHQQLMAQCLGQLRFEADIKQIKRRIQSLIESDYLERDQKNSSVYHYKA